MDADGDAELEAGADGSGDKEGGALKDPVADMDADAEDEYDGIEEGVAALD